MNHHLFLESEPTLAEHQSHIINRPIDQLKKAQEAFARGEYAPGPPD